MLAQTQLGRVAGRWDEWMGRFSTPAALARAPLADALELWAGLGYPRRAESLRRAAEVIASDHSGEVPADRAALLALPGIGEYTAAAVLAFAFDEPVMPVDTNVGRVLARAVAGRPLRRGDALGLASAMTDGSTGGRLRARAVMDFGATVCTARSPACHTCPLATGVCAWRSGVTGPGGESGPAVDPWKGTFAASVRQAPYRGSDREGRGRILRRAGSGAIPVSELPAAAGWPADPDRAERAARSLVADRLLVEVDGTYRLP